MPQEHNRLAMVTGTSSGIGEALVRQLLERGWRVIGLARRAAAVRAPHYVHLRIDLADVQDLAVTLDAEVAASVADPTLARLALVNNAADVALQGPLDHVEPQGMLRALTVNTVAPVLLMGWMLRNSASRVPLRIVNVSSAAAVDPFPGLGVYGSSKAALRHAGQIFAAELDLRAAQGGSTRDVTIWSYEPGVVDTPMQLAARSSAPAVLPVVEAFMNFKASGMLRPVAAPAREISRYLEADGHPRFSEQRTALSAAAADSGLT